MRKRIITNWFCPGHRRSARLYHRANAIERFNVNTKISIWSCSLRKKRQLKLIISAFRFRHGFWAQSRTAKNLRQHPRNCRNEQALPLNTVNWNFSCILSRLSSLRLLSRSSDISVWCRMNRLSKQNGRSTVNSAKPTRRFHNENCFSALLTGTCAFRTADEYLNTIDKLYEKLNIPNLKPLLADPRVDQYKIKKAFLEKNPKLRANQIVVYMKGKELVDVKICYDMKLNYSTCYR